MGKKLKNINTEDVVAIIVIIISGIICINNPEIMGWVTIATIGCILLIKTLW
jgi:uncharacterized protein (DUF983 family)